MIEFTPFPKIARLNRNIIITEKIDGTNAAVGVVEGEVYAQSRTRLITPEQDNFGFARWVQENASALRAILGEGIHFGEWWGLGIQRGYGQTEKRFSLFNSHRWGPSLSPLEPDNILEYAPAGLGVVPVLYEGPFDQGAISDSLAALRDEGSRAAPGFMDPEGVVVYMAAARTMFKVTLKNDEKPKGSQEEG